jgi:hypothetical protein
MRSSLPHGARDRRGTRSDSVYRCMRSAAHVEIREAATSAMRGARSLAMDRDATLVRALFARGADLFAAERVDRAEVRVGGIVDRAATARTLASTRAVGRGDHPDGAHGQEVARGGTAPGCTSTRRAAAEDDGERRAREDGAEARATRRHVRRNSKLRAEAPTTANVEDRMRSRHAPGSRGDVTVKRATRPRR